jgi:SAM-dependent methyltransferase
MIEAKHVCSIPADPFLIAVGISDKEGLIKPSKADKYRQVEEFLRLLVPTLNAAISAGHIPSPTTSNPLTIVDLGCGHAYLTFAAHQYLRKQGIPVSVIGIDVRVDSRDRNNEIAKKLGIDKSIEFRAEEIADTQCEIRSCGNCAARLRYGN